jgi:hypothetical protein
MAMTLEQELLDKAGSRMAAEIDFGVMCSLLEGIGWKKVILNPMSTETSNAIDVWTSTELKGNFHTMGLVWVFEDAGDAVNFTLKYGN